MDFIAYIQYETFKRSRNAKTELENLISDYQQHIKRTNLATHTRYMLKEDVKKLRFIIEDLKALQIMTGFYTKDSINNIRKVQNKLKKHSH